MCVLVVLRIAYSLFVLSDISPAERGTLPVCPGIPCGLASLTRVPVVGLLGFAKGRLFFELAAFYEVVEEVGVGF